MSQIRRQSILSTVFVYVGFFVGFVNTYLFTRQGFFSESQYGLTQIFVAVGNLMFAFANLGTISAMYKFYPYYNDNLPKKKNDLLTWALVVSTVGFLFVLFVGLFLKKLVIQKFGEHSPEFVQYYFWVFPFGFSILIYTILEVFAWNLRKSILTSFLREVFFRLLTSLLILLFVLKAISGFDQFIKFYSLTYGVTAAVLFIYLFRKGELHITFSLSRVTKKFYKKMSSFALLIYFGGLVAMIAQFIDTIVIMSLIGTTAAGIFSLGSVVAGLVQAPQRGAVAASIPVLSKAWKDKDYEKIGIIYQRSGINLLIASLGLFLLVWLNYTDAVVTFHLKPSYLQSQWIFFFLGLARIVDLGTGVNSQIIGTSIYWKFEFFSGMILLALAIPLNYFLVKKFGMVGAGYSNLIAYTVYNVIRIIFLERKYNMHPFSNKTIYAILLAFVSYMICYYSFLSLHGFLGILVKACTFIALYGGSVIYFDLSPDVIPVWKTIRKKSRIFPSKRS